MNQLIRIATRKSPLALAQTQAVMDRLIVLYPDTDITAIPLSSGGDDDLSRSLNQFSETGIFVKALEQALLNGKADCALHCLKDIPAPLASDFVLAAFLPREKVNDVLICSPGISPDNLTQTATGSSRRQIFLGRKYPNCSFQELRGNINSRIAKAAAGEIQSLVLAEVGVNRLKLFYQSLLKNSSSPSSLSEEDMLLSGKVFLDNLARVSLFPLSTDFLLPAPGQGILVLQCRADDDKMISALSPLNHPPSAQAATIERAVMEKVEGGCRTPLGVWARPKPAASSERNFLVEAAMEREGKISTARAEGREGLAEEIVSQLVN